MTAAAGLVGGAGLLLWGSQPAPAHNAAAGAEAGTQESIAHTGGKPAEGQALYNHKPVYDIDILNKNYPREVPAFIEVCVACVYTGVLGVGAVV